MRSIKQTTGYVRFPKKEKAYALVPSAKVPFLSAVAGMTYPDADYYIERNASHKITVFEYVLNGEGEILLNGVWKKVKAGEVYILRAGEEHSYRSDRDVPYEKLWINYTADYLGAMMDAYGVCSGIYNIPKAKKYFEMALDAARLSGTYADSCQTLVECVHKIVYLASLGESELERSDAYTIREELNAALYQKLDLNVLSEKLHISKSNMIRVFKRRYGITPYEYLLTSKIEAAKALLLNTQLSIKEIADRLCILDEHYFSTLFQSRVGIRPTEFRKNERGES
jgi:AraC-like DNA-binding protein